MLAASGELLIILGLLRIARKARKEFGAEWCEERGVGRLRRELGISPVIELGQQAILTDSRCGAAVEEHCKLCGKCRFGRPQVTVLPPRSAQ